MSFWSALMSSHETMCFKCFVANNYLLTSIENLFCRWVPFFWGLSTFPPKCLCTCLYIYIYLMSIVEGRMRSMAKSLNLSVLHLRAGWLQTARFVLNRIESRVYMHCILPSVCCETRYTHTHTH